MDRPSKEQVETALAEADEWAAGAILADATDTLAAEVRALRAERMDPFDWSIVGVDATCTDCGARITKIDVSSIEAMQRRLLGEVAHLRAAIARVEALCAENEARNGDRELCWMVADEYRAALRGPT